jgi:hypothetical protein
MRWDGSAWRLFTFRSDGNQRRRNVMQDRATDMNVTLSMQWARSKRGDKHHRGGKRPQPCQSLSDALVRPE